MSHVAQFSTELVQKAFQRKASDIHFIVNKEQADIFFRIDGKRTRIQSISSQFYRMLLTHFKFLSGMDIGENMRPQSKTITDIDNGYDLRLSTLPIIANESLAIRILPTKSRYSLNNSFLFPFQLEQLLQLTTKQSGIFLLSGPTGSGKSTTLYNLIQFLIETFNYQAVTLEDPIEQTIDQAIQLQTNHITGFDYVSGLKAILRHDPDIIMIGEIRDKETALTAFEAALTGHLVFSTIHSKDANGTIRRLLDMGFTETDLQQALIGVAASRLVHITTRKDNRRAAILDFLSADKLNHAIKQNGLVRFQEHPFDKLLRKAYAYGFIQSDYESII